MILQVCATTGVGGRSMNSPRTQHKHPHPKQNELHLVPRKGSCSSSSSNLVPLRHNNSRPKPSLSASLSMPRRPTGRAVRAVRTKGAAAVAACPRTPAMPTRARGAATTRIG